MKIRRIVTVAAIAAFAVVSVSAKTPKKGGTTAKKAKAAKVENVATKVDDSAPYIAVVSIPDREWVNDLKKQNAVFGDMFENARITPSGLMYVTLTEGTGAQPGPTDEVTVHYTGYLPDGTVFDSSVDRGEPIAFPLNRVIAGWTEGVQKMKEGGQTAFYIPSELAYGKRGTPGGPIGPNQDLIFIVELLKVNK